MDNKGQFQKGKSGNPSGRPRSGEALTELLREYLEGSENDDRITRKRLLVEELYRRAMGSSQMDEDGSVKKVPGSDELLKYLVNRLDGMPRQAVDLDAFIEGDESLTVFIEQTSTGNAADTSPEAG